MKHLLHKSFGLWLLMAICLPAQAQWFGTPAIINPAAPLACNPFTVSFDWTLGCINYTVNGYTQIVTTDTIFIDVSISGGPICLGALSFYNHTESFSNVPAGNYTLKLRSFTNGIPQNSQTQPLNIGSCCTANASFTANTPNLQLCPGDSLTFSAVDQSLVSYNWSLNGQGVGTGLQQGISFNQTGTYTVELEGGDSTCTSTSSQTITVSTPTASISGSTDESCPGTADGSVDLSVSSGVGPYTYTWSNGATSQDLSQLSSGTYSVIVNDAIGCSAFDTVSLAVGIPVSTAFSASDSLICSGESISFTDMSTGASMYNWYQNGVLVDQTATPSISFVNSGSYTILLVSENATCDDSASLQVNVFDPASLSATTTDETCANSQDGMIDLQLSGGTAPFTYSWSNGANTQDLSQINTGTYTVTVTDSLGCTASDMYTVNIGAGITADFSYTDSTAICEGETIDFTNTSSGGTSLNWFSNGQAFSSMATPSLAFPDAGNYTIKLVINDANCSDSTDLTIVVTAPADVGGNLMDPICPGDLDGAIDLTLSGGVMPFSFDWSNGETTEDISSLDSGMYVVEITDGVGCVTEDTFHLDQLGGLIAAFDQTVGGSYVQLMDMSDTTAVSWAWDFGDGNTSTDQDPLHQYAFFGSYTVCLTVTDGYGCMDTVCNSVDIATAIDPEHLRPLVVYPNPTRSELLLSLPDDLQGAVRISLFDVAGRRVRYEEKMAQPTLRLDLSALASGLYSLLLTDGEQYFQAKLMKE